MENRGPEDADLSFEKRKECLKEEIARAERLEHPYDDLFSSGEKIEMRNLWVAVRSL